MIGFIDDYRGAYGVEPICRVLKIAPSTYTLTTRGGVALTRRRRNLLAQAVATTP
jgi:hypothetical protein